MDEEKTQTELGHDPCICCLPDGGGGGGAAAARRYHCGTAMASPTGSHRPIGLHFLIPIHPALILSPAIMAAAAKPARWATALMLAGCVAGIYMAYLTQGVVQEKLSTKTFGPERARFVHLASLNAVQCWVCFLWAAVLMIVFDKR